MICTSQEEPVCPTNPEQGGGGMDKDNLPKGTGALKAAGWQTGTLQNTTYPPQRDHPYSSLAQAVFWQFPAGSVDILRRFCSSIFVVSSCP